MRQLTAVLIFIGLFVGAAATVEAQVTTYQVQVDGKTILLERASIGAETAVVTQRTVAPDGTEFIQVTPGRTQSDALTIVYPTTSAVDPFYDWHLAVKANAPEARKLMTLIGVSSTNLPLLRFELARAWVSSIRWSRETTSPYRFMTTVEIVYESMSMRR
jgi:hypothetical protein